VVKENSQLPETAPKRAALRTIFEKLAKRIPHFGNTNDGEALAALRDATRLLASAKLDWHDILTLLTGEPQSVLDLLTALLGRKDVDVLLHLAREKATFFCTNGGEVYATVDSEILPVNVAGEFNDWLWDAFLLDQKRAPTPTAVKNAIRALQAVARRRGERHEVYIRSAAIDGRIYIDLANDQRQAVEIDSNGWRIINNPPVKFWRPTGMRPLPEPQREQSIEQLRRYTNLSDAGFILFVQLLIDALHARDERPVGCFVGGEGRGKSTLSKLAQRILDPRTTDPGNPPSTVRELITRARNGTVVVFDNASTLSQDMSDAICRLASGIGSGQRKLFTDVTQIHISGSRPIMFTAIRNPVKAPDLADRTVVLKILAIEDRQRITPRRLWAAFYRDLPYILGALYHITACGLRELPRVKLARAPRLAEFFEGGIACEAGHELGSFLAAFDTAAQEALDAVVEDSALAQAVIAFMADRDGQAWSGSATALMKELMVHDRTEAHVTTWKDWPQDARAFGAKLWPLQTVLRKVGVDLIEGARTPDRHRGRRLELRMIDLTAESAPGKSDTGDEAERPAANIIALRKST
jgi:hypothetical protein